MRMSPSKKVVLPPPSTIPDHVLRAVPERAARAVGMVVFSEDDTSLRVAMRDAHDLEPVRQLERKTGKRVIPYAAPEAWLEAALAEYGAGLTAQLSLLLDAAPTAEDAASAEALQRMLAYAATHGATDMALAVRGGQAAVRARIDGAWREVAELPASLLAGVRARIRTAAGIAADAGAGAHHGAFREHAADAAFAVDVTVTQAGTDETLTLRLSAAHDEPFPLEALGLSGRDVSALSAALGAAGGLVLFAGTDGSGRTATAYAALRTRVARGTRITTIEDPRSHRVAGVQQITVGPSSGFTFAGAMRTAMRQDAEIILVGEHVEEGMATLAVNAAMTGHLVLSVVRAPNAAEALARLRREVAEPFLLASAVTCVVAQRLVRQICQRCIAPHDATEKELRAQGVPEEALQLLEPVLGVARGRRLFRGSGCDECGYGGYVDRLGIFEVLTVDGGVREALSKKGDSSAITKAALAAGMTTMLEDGMAKVRAGVTTLEEVLRAVGRAA